MCTVFKYSVLINLTYFPLILPIHHRIDESIIKINLSPKTWNEVAITAEIKKQYLNDS